MILDFWKSSVGWVQPFGQLGMKVSGQLPFWKILWCTYMKKIFLWSLVHVLFERCCWELYQDFLQPSSTEDSWPEYFFFIFLTSQEQCLNSFLDNVTGVAGRWHSRCLKFMVKRVKNIFCSFCSLLAECFYSRITHLTFFSHILLWNQYGVGIQLAEVFKPNICLELITYTEFFKKEMSTEYLSASSVLQLVLGRIHW